ncbi:MAG TPA: CoA transferase [Candidatus Binatia bacterium]|jgi:crotonobetainyl-CoA:carnitine CoA-transferase CaiB-like acyl-CoA transferase|nr:CoA transferase [Candidatus Binatia bacterium]
MSGEFLKGFRALDLTDLSGQLCGRVLADLGMEVIKIEPPGGDPVRNLAPFIISADGKRLSTVFAHLNAGKASKVLDLNAEAGRAQFRELVKDADVVIESFQPGDLDGKGLGYQDLTTINRRIVMASITGFGQTGPKKNLACNDLVALAESGFLYISGDPSLPPAKPPETQAYYFASLFATAGLLAALYRRERTGQGDHVDASMQEALATQEHIIRLWANEQQIAKRAGSQHGSVAPAKIFSCKDGFVYLYVTRQHWKLFLSLWKEHPTVFDAPDWLNNLYRRAHADELNRAVEAFLNGFTMAEITEFLQAKGIPCVPVNTPLGFTNDEQVRERGFMAPVEHAGFGKTKQPAIPFVIDGARPPVGSVPVLDSWQPSAAIPNERQGSKISPFDRNDRIPGNDEGRGGETLSNSDGPLHGMRIVSFDHVLAGPYGTTILAELGADVIKVESSKGGMDPFRFFGTGEDPNLSPRFLEFNRNKRSFTVNLKHPKGQTVLHDLVAKADAVLDNYSVDVVERIGLAYDQLRKVNRDIINLRMPGLGTTGPKRHFSTVGVNITAFTGLTHLWNHPGVTHPPIGSQTVFPDYVSGTLCAIIIISGVIYRERQKRGAFIDLGQSEATAFMIGAHLMEAAASEKNPEPIGNLSLSVAPHGCYPCLGEDRWCVIAAESEQQWAALAKIIGSGTNDDPRFATNAERLKNRDALDAMIGSWTKTKDAFALRDQLQGAGIPCGVVQTGEDLVNDPHLQQRGFIVAVDNPRLGRVVLPNFPLQFTNAKLTRRWEFPVLGRDTETVLRDVVGYDEATIAAHRRDGVLE